MSQRFSPNPGSVEHSLSALFPRIGRRRLNAPDWNDPDTLPRLAQIQQINGEAIDPDTVMDRVAKLALKELSADGTGVWLFTENETFLGAGAGKASNDERLRLALLSTLLTSWRLSKDSRIQVGKPVASGGGIRSWLVEPIYQGHNVAGVLAAFSSRLDAFAELDAAKIHLIADVLAQTLTKAAAAGFAKSTALEPALVLALIERMIPGLRNMVGGEGPWSDLIGGVQKTDSNYEPFPEVLNAESSREMNAVDETVRATAPVDATWLATDPAPLPPPGSAIGADHRATAGTGGATTSESAAVECSSLDPEARPNWDRAAIFVKNFTFRTLADVRVARAWLVSRGGFQSQPGLRTLVRTATVLVTVTTIGFLVLKTGGYSRTQVAVSGLGTGTPEKRDPVADDRPTYRETPPRDDLATVAAPQPHLAEQARASTPMQGSHMQVTDRNARNALHALSQYELVGLRRRALYGDDSAAFLVGMAYEVGHGVRQDCKTAAHWVANAAAEGNAVAQFNLGLRYRDGDGVAMNAEAAMKWLRMAAGHQIPGAQGAFAAFTSRQGRAVASRP